MQSVIKVPNQLFMSLESERISIDDFAKGGLTQFWELFTMISCAKIFKTLITSLFEDIWVSN